MYIVILGLMTTKGLAFSILLLNYFLFRHALFAVPLILLALIKKAVDFCVGVADAATPYQRRGKQRNSSQR